MESAVSEPSVSSRVRSRRYRVVGAIPGGGDVTTILFEAEDGPCLRFAAGQAAAVRLPGRTAIRAPLTSDPGDPGHLGITIMGREEDGDAVDRLDVRDPVWIRGPLGRPWPVKRAGGRHLVVVAAGFGMAWVRSLMIAAGRTRSRFASIRLLSSARTPGAVLFRSDLERWPESGIPVETIVDGPGPGWSGPIGPVTSLFPAAVPDEGAVVMIAGPDGVVAAARAALGAWIPPPPVWSRSVDDATPGAVVGP